MSQFSKPWGNYMLPELIEPNEPESISWLPQTMGWQIVCILLIIYILRKTYLAVIRYQRNAYRRDALAWLDNLPEYNPDHPAEVFRQLPALLRKTALCAYSRKAVILPLRKQWGSWLDQQCQNTQFHDKHAELIYQLAYSPAIQINTQSMQDLLTDVTYWITYHRVDDD